MVRFGGDDDSGRLLLIIRAAKSDAKQLGDILLHNAQWRVRTDALPAQGQRGVCEVA